MDFHRGNFLECDSDSQSSKQQQYEKKFTDKCTKFFGSDHLAKQRLKKYQRCCKRIKLLAQPKYITPKYVEREPSQEIKKVQILKPNDEISGRIKMLAFPKVRKLVASHNAYKDVVTRDRLTTYEQFISKSSMTMYSRLANVPFQKKRKQKHAKWTRSDWIRHCEWMKKRACPKVEKKSKPLKRKTVSLQDLQDSIDALSKPKPRFVRQKYRPYCGFKSGVKDEAKLYNYTERVEQLSKPKALFNEQEKEEKEGIIFNPFEVKRTALRESIKISERLLERIKVEFSPPATDPDFTIYGVRKRALTAKEGERTKELAEPKERKENNEYRKEIPKVSKNAMRLKKPSDRIIELAQLPERIQKIVAEENERKLEQKKREQEAKKKTEKPEPEA